MPVYVDNARSKFGRMLMCHMVADTEIELHSMADAIGVDRRHFQDKRYPHYDICLAKRDIAIHNGAFQVSSKTLVRIARGEYQIGRQEKAPVNSGAKLVHEAQPKEEGGVEDSNITVPLDTVQLLHGLLSKVPDCFAISDNPPPSNARFTVGRSGDKLFIRDKLTGEILKIERTTLMEASG